MPALLRAYDMTLGLAIYQASPTDNFFFLRRNKEKEKWQVVSITREELLMFFESVDHRLVDVGQKAYSFESVPELNQYLEEEYWRDQS